MDLKTKALSEGVPIIKDGTLEHLKGLIIKNSYRNILELGTAVGYSAIEMARVDPLIHIDTIERDKERYKEALRNIADEHLQDQIDVYLEDIRELKLWHDYDLIFIAREGVKTAEMTKLQDSMRYLLRKAGLYQNQKPPRS